jgi:uncharacterized protein (TIGR03083 family)
VTDHEELVFQRTSQNRLYVADVLDELDDDQWRAETLCQGWDVHHLAAHFVQPMLVGFGRFFLTAMRYRGDTDRTVDHITRQLAQRSRTELLATLRQHAADRLRPARVGPMGPFAETCLHLRDIARPLGLAADVPLSDWQLLLAYLVSPEVAPTLVPPGRLEGLALHATDASFSHGTGLAVDGPAEALAMAATGRLAAVADLSGPGLRLLRERLQAETGVREV